MTFRGYVGADALGWCSTLFRTKEREADGRSRLPRSSFEGKSLYNQNAPAGQCTWSQVPVETDGLLAGPTQTAVLEAQ